MVQELNFELLKNIYTSSLVPIHFFHEFSHSCSFCTYANEEIAWGNLLKIASKLSADFDEAYAICRDTKADNICYGILNLPNDDFCLVGPFSAETQTFSFLSQYKKYRDLKNIEIPHFSFSRVISVMSLIGYIVLGKDISVKKLVTEHQVTAAGSSNELEEYKLKQAEAETTHHSHTLELKFGEFIQSGDTEAIYNLINEVQPEQVGKISYSALKQQEYSAVMTVSFAAKYAILGGVDQYFAYDLCDLFLQKISSSNSPEQYTQIINSVVERFTKEVNLAKEEKNNLYIQKSKEFIYANLNHPIQVKDIADFVGITPVYLSQIFSKIQGETVKSYILRKRIYHAQNMLKYSDHDISQIASYFCFNSQSHFGAVFKRYTSDTPNNYRKMNKRD